MDYSHFLIIAGLILVNAYFVAAEFALVKVRTSQIDQLVEEGSWAARLTSKALDKLDVYLSAYKSASRWPAWLWGGDPGLGRTAGRRGV